MPRLPTSVDARRFVEKGLAAEQHSLLWEGLLADRKERPHYDRWEGAYVGKLPPGAQGQLDAAITNYRASDVVTHVEIFVPADCPVGQTLANVLFPLATPPSLPVAGCKRAPCCACAYVPATD